MRKITLLIASLFFAIGAIAQTATTYADGVYKIHWSWDKRGYLAYHADYPTSPQLAGVVNHNPNGHYQLTDEGVNLGWYLYTSSLSGKSYLFEATTGKFIAIDESRTVGNGKACALSEDVTEKSMFTLKSTTNTPAYMLTYGTNYNLCSGCGSNKGNDPVRFATDGQSDGGIPFVFVADGVSITDAVKNAAIAKIEAYEATLYPYNGKIYALDSYMDYLYQNTDGSMNIYTNGSYSGVADTRALWKFEYNNGVYNIRNIHTGLYIGTTNHATPAQMSETPGSYEITTAVGSETATGENLYLKVYGQNACLHSTAATAKGWEGGGLGNQYSFAEVTEFSHTLNVTDAEWATIVLGFNAIIPDNVKVYTIASQEDDYVSLEEVTGVLAANVPVLVNAPAGDYDFAYTTDEATVTESGLQGTLYNKDIIVTGAYVLGLIDGEAGFGLATTTGKADGTFTNNANKAYFVPTSGLTNVASYSFRFGEGTTGVEKVEIRNEKEVIYDLTGRCVEEITAPGIYVVNGVKRVVR